MNKRWSVGLVVGILAAGAASYFAYHQRCERCGMASAAPTAPATNALGFEWPPQVGHPYPDLEMIDQTGQKVKLSSFKGKVLIIEPVGMNCAACLAWSGTDRYGPFEGLNGQAGVHSFEQSFESVTHLAFTDPRVMQIQILLFGTKMQATTAADAKAWADHFHRDKAKNQYVFAGSADLLQPARYQATYNQVPGFQLVDKDFILRADATSDNPKINLWTELVPQIPALAAQVNP